MTDYTTNQTNALQGISFAQKSAALSLIIIASTAAYYVATMWPMRPVALATDSIPAGYGSLVLTTLGIIILTEIVLQSVLAFGAGVAAPADDHDRLASLKARQLSYGVLVFGVLAAVGSVFLPELTSFCAANLAFMGLLLSEIVNYSARLIYGRR